MQSTKGLLKFAVSNGSVGTLYVFLSGHKQSCAPTLVSLLDKTPYCTPIVKGVGVVGQREKLLQSQWIGY